MPCLRNNAVDLVMPLMTAPALPVTEKQQAELMRIAASSTLPHCRVVQARALLWAADAVPNQEIARRCEVDSAGGTGLVVGGVRTQRAARSVCWAISRSSSVGTTSSAGAAPLSWIGAGPNGSVTSALRCSPMWRPRCLSGESTS